jgi:uncharacterized protein YxeA
MGNNKVLVGILVILIAIMVGGYIFYGKQIREMYNLDTQKEQQVEKESTDENKVVKEEKKEVEQKLEISATYDTKIVYTSEVSSNTDIYKADCKKREWEFNECGSPCGPGAEFCTAVCAYTCEKPATKIETYTDIILGITFDYPNDMKTDDNDGSLRVYKWGPSQTEGTEIYDGMVISFARAENPNSLDLEAFTKVELENELAFEAEVIKPITAITHGEFAGYEFTTFSLGKGTFFYCNNSAGNIIRITYFAEDPLEQGFEETLNKILESLKVMQ